MQRVHLGTCGVLVIGLSVLVPAQTFRASVHQVAIPVTVQSESGEHAANLTAEDFRVFDNTGTTEAKHGVVFAALNGAMLVRLTKKFAERIDGIDLSPYAVGDTITLPWRAAKILIAEGWAVLIERRRTPRGGANALGELLIL